MINKRLLQSFVVAGVLTAICASVPSPAKEPLQITLISEALAEKAAAEYDIQKTEAEVEENNIETVTLAEPVPVPEKTDWELEQEYCLSQPDNVPYWLSEVHTVIKQWMDYRKVTRTSSVQYKLLNSPEAYTDANTGFRMYKDRICIAVGQGYGLAAGDYVDVVMANGSVIKCIVGDMKQVAHTDPTMRWHIADGHVLEFIVDTNCFVSDPVVTYPDEFNGVIKKLVKIESDESWY